MKIKNVIHTSIADAMRQNEKADLERQERQYALEDQKTGKPSSGKPPLKKIKIDSSQSLETRKGDT